VTGDFRALLPRTLTAPQICQFSSRWFSRGRSRRRRISPQLAYGGRAAGSADAKLLAAGRRNVVPRRRCSFRPRRSGLCSPREEMRRNQV